MEDRELLQQFVERRSDEAFGELVRRHLDLVYSTAFRVVRDPDLAKDVCQSVFLRLARKPCSVREGNALPGWLYRAACFEAASALRSDQRRHQREAESMRRAELNEAAEADWQEIHPLLEEAMCQLSKVDQDAVVLRFFENKPLAEVGRLLGLTDEAARKRVSRALERLQAHFTRRGLTVGTGALAVLLAAHAVEAAPAGIALSLTTASLAAGTAAGTAGFFSTLTPALLMTKTSAVIIGTFLVVAAVTPLLLTKLQKGTASTKPEAGEIRSVNPAAVGADDRTSRRPVAPPTAQTPGLLARVAVLPPLTATQIEAYVEENKRSAESLLAAYRMGGEQTYLAEAAERFPGDPDVQYAVISAWAFPDVRRHWIEAFKSSSQDNSLAWYFSALDHFQAGDALGAMEDLAEAGRKKSFRAELAPTLQAVEELQMSAGRASDEARITAFQASAQVPHLIRMRELAQAMQKAADNFKQRGDTASLQALVTAGLQLGGHLSAGSGSQTLINQLVGISIEKKFLEQLDPSTGLDPFGRPIAELKTAIEQQQSRLKDYAKASTQLLSSLSDTELATYMERVKLHGEEAALTWLQAKHGSQ